MRTTTLAVLIISGLVVLAAVLWQAPEVEVRAKAEGRPEGHLTIVVWITDLEAGVYHDFVDCRELSEVEASPIRRTWAKGEGWDRCATCEARHASAQAGSATNEPWDGR